jgi:hypothetical protein
VAFSYCVFPLPWALLYIVGGVHPLPLHQGTRGGQGEAREVAAREVGSGQPAPNNPNPRWLGPGAQAHGANKGVPRSGDPAQHCMCSVQVIDKILTKVPFRKYHIPQSGTIETLQDNL